MQNTEAAWGLKGADSFSQKIFLPKTLKHSARNAKDNLAKKKRTLIETPFFSLEGQIKIPPQSRA